MPRQTERFRVQNRGRFWYWKPSGGKWSSTGWEVKRKTEERVKKDLNLMLDKQGDAGPAKQIKFGVYADDFFSPSCSYCRRQAAKGKPLSPEWIKQRRSHVINHLIPLFGDECMDEITMVMIENRILSRTRGIKKRIKLPDGTIKIEIEVVNLSTQTKHHIMGTLQLIIKDAFRDDVIDRNPFDKVEAIHVTFKERHIFLPEEHAAFFPIQDIEELARLFGTFMVGVQAYLTYRGALRSQEVRAPYWSDLFEITDRKDRLWHGLYITKAIKASGKSGSTKNKDPRAILLEESTYNLLMKWKKVCEWTDPEDLIFCFFRKQPMDSKVLRRGLYRALGLCKIPRKGRDVHCLRHTRRTELEQLVIEGVLSESAVNFILGHKSPLMGRRYDHTTPEDRIRMIAGDFPAG